MNTRRQGDHLVIVHNYRDYAKDPVATDNDQNSNNSSSRYSSSKKLSASFPVKLHRMLHSVETDGLAHVCSWQPHGRCFVVHDQNNFCPVLLRYFDLSKIPSFQRQLNLYGFRRLTKGADRGAYYHEKLLRGRPELAATIHRSKIKGTKVRPRSNPDKEPNFYAMPWVGTGNNTTTYKTDDTNSVQSSLMEASSCAGGESQHGSHMSSSNDSVDMDATTTDTSAIVPPPVTSSFDCSIWPSIDDDEDDLMGSIDLSPLKATKKEKSLPPLPPVTSSNVITPALPTSSAQVTKIRELSVGSLSNPLVRSLATAMSSAVKEIEARKERSDNDKSNHQTLYHQRKRTADNCLVSMSSVSSVSSMPTVDDHINSTGIGKDDNNKNAEFESRGAALFNNCEKTILDVEHSFERMSNATFEDRNDPLMHYLVGGLSESYFDTII